MALEFGFWLGLIIGLFISLIIFWFLIAKKSKAHQVAIALLDKEKKQAIDALMENKAQLAVGNEKLEQAEGFKYELEKYRQLLDDARLKTGTLLAKVASLEVENKKNIEHYQSRMLELTSFHGQMKDAFAILSKDALLTSTDLLKNSFHQSLEHFLKVAEKDRSVSQELLANIMKPLKESLTQVNTKVGELESKRQGAYDGLKEQIEGLLRSQSLLQKETQNLSGALRAPTIKGRFGEMQLRRVVELSGLSPHCDFVEQKSIQEEDGTRRPDMIVTLPKNRKIIIDAKAPIEFFGNDERNESIKEEERAQQLALSLKRHLLTLKKKSYYSIINDTPEFIVMFLPSEALLHWALTADPLLLDFAAQNEILITTPVTLVALLKAIAFNFTQEAVANNIEEVRHLSQQLIDRVQKVTEHFDKLGRSLKQATQCYNQTLSSLDSRVLVTARKLASIKSINKEQDEFVITKLPLIEEVISNPNVLGEGGDTQC
jgi:DNA recombination protein RmuC